MYRIASLVLLLGLLVLSVSPPAHAQAPPVRTTTSATLSAGSAYTLMYVVSSTGMTASTGSQQRFILVDRELMELRAINSTTLTVKRAAQGVAVAHASGAAVYWGPTGSWNPTTGNTNGLFIGDTPSGTCTRSLNQYLPVFAPLQGTAGTAYNCNGGTWVLQQLESTLPAPLQQYCTVPVGSVAYASFGNATTLGGSGYLYVASINVPKTQLFTGVYVLQNGTVATNALIGALYDSGGTLLANSATAGVTTVGANTFLQLPFTATYLTSGPANYFIGVQGNGTTDGIRTVAASTFVGTLSQLRSSGTFGTLGTFTVPTTWTANQAPIACLY